MTHPSNRLDDTVHQRARLGILALATPAKAVDFTYLRDTLELSDGNLSRHLQVLADVGYVKIAKKINGNRVRTTVSITREGRRAFKSELAALREIVVSGLD